MTSPEHTLVGILGAMSIGLHKRLGWPVVVFAGLASNVPDWDGVPMLFDMQKFESGHRVWGHSVGSILITALILAWAQNGFRFIEKLAERCKPFLPSELKFPERKSLEPIPFTSLAMVGVLFQAIHLVCDMTVSGGRGLSHWEVQPLWPFSAIGFVVPLLPWGDIGPTLITMASLIFMAKYPGHSQRYAVLGLVILGTYMVLRGVPARRHFLKIGDANPG